LGISVGITKKPTVAVKCVGPRSITISIVPPEDAPSYVVITYLILYGKAREYIPKTTNETTVTLTKLRENMEYHIIVKAKAHIREEFGPPSDTLKVTTNQGSIEYRVIHNVI